MGVNDVKTSTSSRFSIDLIQGAEQDAAFSAVVDAGFRVPAGKRFLDDFPIWDPKMSSHGGSPEVARLGVFAGKTLVATTGVRMAKLHSPHGPLSIAIIGAVSTEEKFRGKGLASSLVQVALTWARKRGAGLALLWGSEHSLYERLGFELCGQQIALPLAEAGLVPSTPVGLIGQGWTPALFELLRNRGTGLVLEPTDLSWYQAHRNVQWYWTGPRSRPTAYAALGRGIDLQGFVHEWGGDPKELSLLFTHLLRQNPGAMLLGSPELLRKAGFPVQNRPVECLGMAQVLDPEKVLKAFAPRADVRFDPAKTGWSLRFAGDSTLKSEVILSERELTRLFFGALTKDPALEKFRAVLRSPFPLWVWGLDAA